MVMTNHPLGNTDADDITVVIKFLKRTDASKFALQIEIQFEL
jgi:hypothetical protein